MLPYTRRLILLILVALFAAALHTYADTSPFTRHTRTIRGDGSTGPYSLGEAIIGGTIGIEADSLFGTYRQIIKKHICA